MTCVLYEERLQVLKKHRCKIEDKIKAIKQASELPELSIEQQGLTSDLLKLQPIIVEVKTLSSPRKTS